MNQKNTAAIMIGILMVMAMSYLFLKPAITGLITFTEENSYNETLNLEINSSIEYEWNVQNKGNIKSIRISGIVEKGGYANIYIEKGNATYLIFNSSKQYSGIAPVTGLAVENVSAQEASAEIIEDISKTENKTIAISLEYNSGTEYDPNDDGIETINGIVDLTVKNTEFSWEPGSDKLCTRWRIYSIENNQESTVCYGSERCCNLINLAPTSSEWNDIFYIYYGLYRAGKNNIISAQVIYADYNLTLENPYAEVYYSQWPEKDVKFYKEMEEFTSVCEETCILSGFNETSYNLIFEISNTSLTISSIEYTVEETVEKINRLPILTNAIPNITISKNQNYTIMLDNYFYDEDNDSLSYSYYKTENITISIDGSIAVIAPDRNFTGTRFSFFIANDSRLTEASNVFTINVTEEMPMCSPTSNLNWIITDSQICSEKNIDLEEGDIIMRPGGTLTLIKNSIITAKGIAMNRTGDSVFVEKGSELRIG